MIMYYGWMCRGDSFILSNGRNDNEIDERTVGRTSQFDSTFSHIRCPVHTHTQPGSRFLWDGANTASENGMVKQQLKLLI